VSLHHATVVELVLNLGIGYFVFGRIFSKAGYSRWECLLMVVPILNLLALGWFAYADWPIERELQRLKFPRQGDDSMPPLSIRGLPQGRV